MIIKTNNRGQDTISQTRYDCIRYAKSNRNELHDVPTNVPSGKSTIQFHEKQFVDFVASRPSPDSAGVASADPLGLARFGNTLMKRSYKRSYPLGIKHSHGKSQFLMDRLPIDIYKLSFSIAMLNYQRVGQWVFRLYP